jgi:hypothetical protein
MKILDRDDLDKQRENYTIYINALNKVAKGVGDGTLKGEAIRDMLLILQARLLAFILSELVHMSHNSREIEDQSEIEIADSIKSQIVADVQVEEEADGYNQISEDPLDSPSKGLDVVTPSEPDYERGSTDLLGRFRGLGLVPDEEPPAEHIPEESGDEPISPESEKMLGGTAELLSALAAIEADSQDKAQKIVDDIYKHADEVEDEESDETSKQ